MVYYGLNKIKLASDAQYKMVILLLLTYLVALALATSTTGFGLGLRNAIFEPIPTKRYCKR